MTNEAIVETMKTLKTKWAILKDEKKSKVDRREACQEIVKLSEEAKKLDPKFEVIDMSSTIYAEFLPQTYKKFPQTNVIWGELTDPKPAYFNAKELILGLESIAVQMTRERLPKEPEDSQKFGMITSAYTDKLLKAYIFQNS